METLTLLVDTLAVVAVIYFSFKNDTRPDGTPEIGFFRIKSDAPPPKPTPSTAIKRGRRRI